MPFYWLCTPPPTLHTHTHTPASLLVLLFSFAFITILFSFSSQVASFPSFSPPFSLFLSFYYARFLSLSPTLRFPLLFFFFLSFPSFFPICFYLPYPALPLSSLPQYPSYRLLPTAPSTFLFPTTLSYMLLGFPLIFAYSTFSFLLCLPISPLLYLIPQPEPRNSSPFALPPPIL